MSLTNCFWFNVHLPRQRCQLLRGMDAFMTLVNCNFIACTPAQAITGVNYWVVRTRVCPWLIAFLCIFHSSRNSIWGLLRGTDACMPPTNHISLHVSHPRQMCYFCMGCDACSCWSATVRMEVHTTGWPAAGGKFGDSTVQAWRFHSILTRFGI